MGYYSFYRGIDRSSQMENKNFHRWHLVSIVCLLQTIKVFGWIKMNVYIFHTRVIWKWVQTFLPVLAKNQRLTQTGLHIKYYSNSQL